MRRPEEALQRQVAAYLDAVPDLLWWATANQRGTRARFEMGVLKAMGVKPGVPDISILLPGGKIGFLELKAGRGKLSEHQAAFISRAMDGGARVGVCYSLDDVLVHLSAWLGPYGYRLPRLAA